MACSALTVRSTVATPDEQRRRPTDALQRGERIPAQLVALAHQADQDPLLALLGEEADVESRRPVDAQVGHLGQLGIAQCCAVLGPDLKRHGLLRARPAAPTSLRAGRAMAWAKVLIGSGVSTRIRDAETPGPLERPGRGLERRWRPLSAPPVRPR